MDRVFRITRLDTYSAGGETFSKRKLYDNEKSFRSMWSRFITEDKKFNNTNMRPYGSHQIQNTKHDFEMIAEEFINQSWTEIDKYVS